jgi:hypothetical protein
MKRYGSNSLDLSNPSIIASFLRKRGNFVTSFISFILFLLRLLSFPPYIILMKPVLDLIGEWESIFSLPSKYYSQTTILKSMNFPPLVCLFVRVTGRLEDRKTKESCALHLAKNFFLLIKKDF